MPLKTPQWLRADKTAALADSVLRSVVRIAAAVTVARITDAGGFASFVTLSAMETIGTALAGAGISNPLITLLPARGKADAQALIKAAQRWSIISSSLFSVTGFLLAWGLMSCSILEAGGYACFVLASNLSTTQRAKLTAEFRSSKLLLADTTGACVAACMVFLLAHTGVFNGNELVWMALGAGAALTCGMLMLPYGFDIMAADSATQKTANDDMKRLAMPMVIGSAGVTVSSRLQPFALEAAAGAGAVAVFGAAQSLAGPLRLMSMSLSGLVRPRLALHLAKGNLHAANRTLLLSMAPPVALSLLSVPVILLAGRDIKQAIFGTGIPYSAACLLGLFVYAGLEALGANLTIALQTFDTNGSKRATILRLFAAAAALALLWPSAAIAGASGSAWSLVIIEALFTVFMYVSYKRAAAKAAMR